MPTREDVIYAYRMLLGREPESEAVVHHDATELATVAALREVFMTSAEFRERLGNLLAARRPRAVPTGKPMQVELLPQGTPASWAARLDALFAKVAAQWEHLGETEPHWSVLTNDSYRAERIAGNEQAGTT